MTAKSLSPSSDDPAAAIAIASPQLAALLAGLQAVELAHGDQGTAVLKLQALLTQLQIYPHVLTGDYDWQTLWAVQTLQARLGIEITGQFDLATWSALDLSTRSNPAHLASSPVSTSAQSPQPLWDTVHQLGRRSLQQLQQLAQCDLGTLFNSVRLD